MGRSSGGVISVERESRFPADYSMCRGDTKLTITEPTADSGGGGAQVATSLFEDAGPCGQAILGAWVSLPSR